MTYKNNIRGAFLTTLLTSFLLYSSMTTYAQVNFEAGYFIDSSGTQVNCLIKNKDWQYNPNYFSYKLTKDAEAQEANVEQVKEFGIGDNIKYVQFFGEIDKTGDKPTRNDDDRQFIFVKERLFLKVLIDGEADLYSYTSKTFVKFFYRIKDQPIEQLKYKKFYNKNGTVQSNSLYKKQLSDDLTCATINFQEINSTEYKIKNLLSLFTAYNDCTEVPYVHYKKKKRDLFNLTFRAGLQSSTFRGTTISRVLDFDRKFGVRFGAELEFVLPFNQNKWAVIFEPSLQTYASNNELASLNYLGLEAQYGIRYAFFLNEQSKIFISGFVSTGRGLNSAIEYHSGGINLELRPAATVGIGVGYSINKKLSVELRYRVPQHLLSGYLAWSSAYKNTALIFGYTIGN